MQRILRRKKVFVCFLLIGLCGFFAFSCAANSNENENADETRKREPSPEEEMMGDIILLLLLSKMQNYCPQLSMPLFQAEQPYSISLETNVPYWFRLADSPSTYSTYYFHIAEDPGQDVDIYSQKCAGTFIQSYESGGPGNTEKIRVTPEPKNGEFYAYSLFYFKCHQGCSTPVDFSYSENQSYVP